ncbi:MAG: hypothetical protein RIC84_06155 [Aggregatilineales bacterium]
MNINVYEGTNQPESRMQGDLPVRFGERLVETDLIRRHGATIRLHKDNPKAANQVVMGLVFVIFASSVTTLITFP